MVVFLCGFSALWLSVVGTVVLKGATWTSQWPCINAWSLTWRWDGAAFRVYVAFKNQINFLCPVSKKVFQSLYQMILSAVSKSNSYEICQ